MEQMMKIDKCCCTCIHCDRRAESGYTRQAFMELYIVRNATMNCIVTTQTSAQIVERI